MHPQIDSRLLLKMRMRHLELLDALGETLNIHQAAPRLNLTQPAVSKLLKEIEEIYRTQLFERHPRGIVPTAAGNAVIRWARLTLHNIGESIAESHLIAGGAIGRVRVGAQSVAIPMLVTRVLERVGATAPGVVITVVEGSSEALLPALARNELDMVLGRLNENANTPQFINTALYREPVSFVAAPAHPLVLKGRITFDDLATARWILPPELSPIRRELDAMLAARGMHRPVPRIETMSPLLMQIMLGKGDLIGAMPMLVARHYEAQGLLSVIDLDLPINMPPVTMMLQARDHAPVVQLVIDTVHEIAHEFATVSP